MITTTILYIVVMFLYGITAPLRLFSDVSLNTGFGAAITYINGFLAPADKFLPISTLLTVFAAVVAIEVIVASYKIIKWVYKKIPGVS